MEKGVVCTVAIIPKEKRRTLIIAVVGAEMYFPHSYSSSDNGALLRVIRGPRERD